jgi:MSHA biogenesis protein MshO
MRRATGFTLVELVTSLIILAIVSVGISGFIRSSMQIFNDVTEREQLLGDSQFAVERLTREIRNAIPNSVRLAGDASVHCLQYIPIDYSTFYLQLPQLPSSDTQLTVVEMGDISGNAYVPVNGSTFAVVYPTRSEDVYDPNQNRRRSILACADDGADTSCSSLDDSDNQAQLTVSGAFATTSPANRVYMGTVAHNFCVRDKRLYFHQSSVTANQPVFNSGGVLMAEFIDNTLSTNPDSQSAGSDDPFRVVDASLLSNAYVQLRLRFNRNDEVINYNQEVRIANVP